MSDGLITLEFGQGEAKRQLEFMKEMQAAIDAYYEFLDINMTLVGMIWRNAERILNSMCTGRLQMSSMSTR